MTVDPSIKDQDLELLLHRQLQKLEADVITEGQTVFAEADSTTPEIYQERLNDYSRPSRTLTSPTWRRTSPGGGRSLTPCPSSSDPTSTASTPEKTPSTHCSCRCARTPTRSAPTPLTCGSSTSGSPSTTTSPRTRPSRACQSPDPTQRRSQTSSQRDSSVSRFPGTGGRRRDAAFALDRRGRDQATDAERRLRGQGPHPADSRLREARASRRSTDGSRAPDPTLADQPAFCYVLADLTPTMISRCEYARLRPTHDGMGYFGFNEPLKAYIEVMSFDRLVNSATERNRAFFDKLGLPSTSVSSPQSLTRAAWHRSRLTTVGSQPSLGRRQFEEQRPDRTRSPFTGQRAAWS